jgi:1-acyl-sn-glycerol-3-phosphate acyltransferase
MGLSPWYAVLAFGNFPLFQTRHQEASLRQLVRVAQAGNAILIFPQGTHARPEDERAGNPSARFRTGVAHLAEALDAPVIPFGLAGTERVLPPTLDGYEGPTVGGVPLRAKPGPLAISFGEAMRRGPAESADAFTERLEAECFLLTRLAESRLASLESDNAQSARRTGTS